MIPRLAVLSRYTGAHLARSAGRARLPGLIIPSLSTSILQTVSYNPSRQFSWSQAQLDWNQDRQRFSGSSGRDGARSVRSRPSRGPPVGARPPNPPSNRLYVGNMTDDNRHEVIAFINTLPEVIKASDELLPDGRRRNFMHMTFKTTEAAQSAMKEIKERFEYDSLRLDFAEQLESSVLYIGDISPTIRPSVLETASSLPGFERFFDYPARDGSVKEYLHVSFSDTVSAADAFAALTKAFQEQGVRLDYAAPRAKTSKAEESLDDAIPPSSDLFIGNLPYDATEAEIIAVFEDIPGFANLYMAKDYNGKNKGFARASFKSVPTASEAIDLLSGRTIHDRNITATYSKSRSTRPTNAQTSTLFIGGLPHDVSEQTLRDAIAGFEGLKNIQIMSQPLSGKPGWALAEYETADQAAAVVEKCHYKPIFPNGPPMRLDYHQSRQPPPSMNDDRHPPSSTLFVGGIRSRTEEDLRDIFSAYSPKQARVVLSNETGNPRGFGYVVFNSVEDATQAMEALNGKDIEQGSNLRVSYAAAQREWNNSSEPKRFGGRTSSTAKHPYQLKSYKKERKARNESQW